MPTYFPLKESSPRNRVHAGGVRVKRMRAPSTLHGSSWMIQIFFFIANGQKSMPKGVNLKVPGAKGRNKQCGVYALFGL